MLCYSRKCMSIIKVTLRYTMLQMCLCIGQAFFGTSSLKAAKTVATKTDCAILYTCLTCVSIVVFLYFSNMLVTYQTARCNNTHDHNMYILQILLKNCEIPMVAQKTLFVVGDKMSAIIFFRAYRTCSSATQNSARGIHSRDCDLTASRGHTLRCSVVFQRVHLSWDSSVQICMIDARQMTPTLYKQDKKKGSHEQNSLNRV
jgi:hypothetical protein